MTRAEVEMRIYQKMQEIVDICKEHDENFDYITLCYINNHIMFCNNHWEKEDDDKFTKKIDFSEVFLEEGGEAEDE